MTARESVTVGAPTVAGDVDPAVRERVRLVIHADGEEAWTRILELPDGGEVTIGRSRIATISIDSELVSRSHSRISRRAGELTVEDLGSRNGTRVNGARIAGPTVLRSGDEVDVGGAATILVNVTTRLPRLPSLASTAELDERLEAEVERGIAYHRSFALAMMRLEGVEAEVDAAFHRIAERARRMDVIADYGPDEIAILLPELDRAAARARAAELVELAGGAADSINVRVGLALFPDHGGSAGRLLSSARAALAAARAAAAGPVIASPDEALADTGEPVVADPQMRKVFELVRRVADTSMPVLIRGETGVGKEIVSAAIHRASARRDRPYLRLNCACLTETLIESELFGHEKGAFTGADQRKTGYFEAADRGTLFLDEIGEITPAVQVKLLRVLEERTLTRVGGTKEIKVDVRIVCATNRDLEAAVKAGTFRADLYFRISAFSVLVPPLRDRAAEIPLLARHFAAQAARALGVGAPDIAPAALTLLESYGWPGNVRELRNAMERAVAIQDRGVIGPEHLPERVCDDPRPRASAPVVLAPGDSVDRRMAELEQGALLAALEECGGNQTRAAQKLGISRRAFVYRMEKHGLKPRPA
ncbi:MAG TPA: sigma 54-interacting transcriptional regulator [Kofleriaceae bacterium]|nr:sigma 54-interacting transcriptional regulator [Kofleriaceae bacterium]